MLMIGVVIFAFLQRNQYYVESSIVKVLSVKNSNIK